jgi:hypothetical protein
MLTTNSRVAMTLRSVSFASGGTGRRMGQNTTTGGFELQAVK